MLSLDSLDKVAKRVDFHSTTVLLLDLFDKDQTTLSEKSSRLARALACLAMLSHQVFVLFFISSFFVFDWINIPLWGIIKTAFTID